MDQLIEYVNKYKARLSLENESKVLQRALQKLDEVDMTITVLKSTGVGKSVNALRKEKVVGEFARELVARWKHLLSSVPQTQSTEKTKKVIYKKDNPYTTNTDDINDEYDPTRNWEMASSVSPQKSYKSSQEDENEYDPTQNWKMKKAKKKQKLTKESGLYNPNIKVKPELESQYNKQSKKSNSNKKYVTSYENSLNNVNDQDEDEYDPCKPAVQIKHKNKITDGHSSDADANGYHVPDYKSSSEDMYSQNSFSLQSNSHKRHQLLETVDHEEGCEYGSKHVKPPKKKSSSDLNSTQTLKAKEKSSVKRKSGGETLDESTSKKSKTSELKEKKSKNKGGNMSFEALMMMDLEKPKKKKKVSKPKPAANHQQKQEKTASSSKVELHLPQIQQTYRPLPRIDDPPTSGKSHQKMTDELAAELITQRNTKRMQIYSGAKAACLPKMLSLYDQCMNVLFNNIDSLDIIGVPYDIIKPVLERCNVEQLYRLEDSNVYLLEDSDELWEKHALQDFKNHSPDEMESWREMYLRLYDAREAKLAKLTHTIQAKVIQAKPLEKRTKLAYVGIGSAKAPRNVQRAQQKYGTAGKSRQFSSSSNHNGDSSSIKEEVRGMRMSVPVGAITAAHVDGNDSRGFNKRNPPRVAPMMAKTLKSMGKLRFRR